MKLKIWYDLHYGGPLTCLAQGAGGRVSANHGAWYAHLLISIPESDAAQWHPTLSWDHRQLGTPSHRAQLPGSIADTVLVAARLARGLTLLTQGTTFDVLSHEYLNPSDWNDRPLNVFLPCDHVTVQQTENDDDASEWFHTLGFTKFGLDELEVIQT